MWLIRELWFHRKNHYLSILSTSVAFFLVLTVSVLSDGLINEITGRFGSLGTDVTKIEVLYSTDSEWFDQIIKDKSIKKHGVWYSEEWEGMDIFIGRPVIETSDREPGISLFRRGP